MAQMVGGLRRRTVAPVRERGLKYIDNMQSKSTLIVAPVRERGLKLIEFLVR